MGIKHHGNSRDEQWRERQRQKQHERQEVEKKAEEEVISTELPQEPESQTGAVETMEQGNPTESGKTTDPPRG